MAPKKAAPEPEEEVKEEPPPEILEGDFVFPDGTTYSGQYMKKGESIAMHGDGFLQSGPETFEGSFENGMYKMGRYSSCSGAVYTGNYRNSKFHGVGDYRWPDGREYRGTWKDGEMHGYGMYLYFSVGADKRFMGFSMNGKFASGAAEQEEAKRAFLQEYGAQCVQSASAALREMAEKSTADGVHGDFVVPKEPELQSERSAIEDMVTGPFPEASATNQVGLQGFVAKLFVEEQALQVSIHTGLGGKQLQLPFNEATFACLGEETRMEKRLKRQQLQIVGQAVQFFSDVEAPALRLLVLVNVASEFDWEAAKWKLVHCE